MSNAMTDGDNHKFYDMPVITIGGQNTGLNVNRFVDVRSNGNDLPTANLFLSLAQQVYGVDINSFGIVLKRLISCLFSFLVLLCQVKNLPMWRAVLKRTPGPMKWVGTGLEL